MSAPELDRSAHYKLPPSAIIGLLPLEVESFAPWALVCAPVYLFLRINQKFIAIKKRFDAFSPEELERFAPFRVFYLPNFVSALVPYRRLGHQMRDLLTARPRGAGRVGLAPYRLSQVVGNLLHPLWQESAEGLIADPLLVTVVVNELLGDIGPLRCLREARPHLSWAAFELVVLRSSWVVFSALLLGITHYLTLVHLRSRALDYFLALSFTPPGAKSGSESIPDSADDPTVDPQDEFLDLFVAAELSLPHAGRAAVQARDWRRPSRAPLQKIHQKLADRTDWLWTHADPEQLPRALREPEPVAHYDLLPVRAEVLG